jgi:uncharacterized membrane protein
LPLNFEYLSPLRAAGLLALLALPIVIMGVRSLAGLGSIRRWVAMGARLAVLLLVVLILAGARWDRTNKDLEVIVCRDISQSTQLVRDFPGASLTQSVDDWLRDSSNAPRKPPDDRIGVVSFAGHALIDALPQTTLNLDTRAVREPGPGTDIAEGIQLALATLHRDAMHRLALITDGNGNKGDLEAAIDAAASQHVPIDVMPLHYDVQNEVLVERFVAPQWKRENEPFTLEVVLRSTNSVPVGGTLTVTHQGRPMDMDPLTPGIQPSRHVTLMPGRNVERVLVPAQSGSDLIHEFHASFVADHINNAQLTTDAEPDQQPQLGQNPAVARAGKTSAPDEPGDTILENNSADAFTFIRGKGKVLYVDNVERGRGTMLRDALASQGIDLQTITPDDFPRNLIEMQNYDAVILANVPRGPGGLSEDQEKMLASYVHDTGGGLVMIGGDRALGAGGWQGSKLEEVLPVGMDIPATRQIPKGALVLIIDEIEQPEGNYWAEQCALRTVETLSAHDDIGIISWNGTPVWNYPLQPKGDGSRAAKAIKSMDPGDMPSFDEMMLAALDGSGGNPGILNDDAKQKHVIIISDDDPQPPFQSTMQRYVNGRITVSCVIDFPEGNVEDSSIMQRIARYAHGRCYGPITSQLAQLPQIFVKEASVIRRSMIYEDRDGIPVLPPRYSELIKGIASFPPVYGLVLTSRKHDPQISVPLSVGRFGDPLLAHWQTGLGKAAVWTSDAHDSWAANWVASADYAKFWAQIVRGVSRPPQSSDFDVQTESDGLKGHITVEAVGKDSTFLNFLSVRGHVVGPDASQQEVHLVQTGPGTYAGDFDVGAGGNYVAVLDYAGPNGTGGVVLGGTAVNDNPEFRDLHSNDSVLQEIAQRTAGRMLPPFDADNANLFSRENLTASITPLPIWDWLTFALLAAIVADVAIRRIAWNLGMARAAADAAASRIRGFTLIRQAQPAQSLEVLGRVRRDLRDEMSRQAGAQDSAAPSGSLAEPPRPNAAAKFDAAGVEGDIGQVVGGATNKPVPRGKEKSDSLDAAAASGEKSSMSSLLAAKRRAQEQIRRDQEEAEK